jgi:hypothetical protein
MKPLLNKIKLILLFGIPVVLLILPKDFFDGGESICVSKVIFDVECYACGLTRACMHLIHLDFEEAFAYNMMSFIAFPALAIMWVKWTITEIKLYKFIRASKMNVAQA